MNGLGESREQGFRNMAERPGLQRDADVGLAAGLGAGGWLTGHVVMNNVPRPWAVPLHKRGPARDGDLAPIE